MPIENATRSKVIQLLVSLHAFVSPRIILAYMRDTPMKLIPSPVTVVLKKHQLKNEENATKYTFTGTDSTN